MPPVTGASRLIWDGVVEALRPGSVRLSGPQLTRVGRTALTLVIVATNLIGAASVLTIALFVVPLPVLTHPSRIRLVNTLVAAGYITLAIPAGVAAGTRRMGRLRDWLLEERRATLAEARMVLRAPLRLFALQLGLWLGAAVLFGVLDAFYSGSLAVRVVVVIVLTGLVTASCSYLLTELLLRPAAARALADGAPGRLAVPGVATRSVLAWAFSTGLPLLGLVAIGALGLSGDRSATRHQLAIAILVIGATGLAVGLLAVGVAARATADPVDSVRRALQRVCDGDFDVRVPVYDGTQIGQLQLGFNAMVAGLAERERIRQAFGTYVDPDVAERVLEQGTDLRGEQLEVTVMFVDIRGFTRFAQDIPAAEVVAALNDLFELIVPILHERGGRVDKFIGDGLMAVFGAPRRQADHADQALKAALAIERALADGSAHRLKVGVGLNSGPVVAGNVGGAGRLEFSVIGDAVNVAARVEAVTRETGDTILLTEATRVLLDGAAAASLRERRTVTLKGKSEPVRLYAPGG